MTVNHDSNRNLNLSNSENKSEGNFEVAGWRFKASQEQLRPPRIVRVGLVQHSIVLPTTSPIKEQRDAIYSKITKYVEQAASNGVNILCLQEAWRMYTRLKNSYYCIVSKF